jgi:hypothetical protein
MAFNAFRRLVVVAAVGVAVSGCGSDTATDPGSLRFGQRGSMVFTLSAPLALGEGRLEQTLRWASDGRWSLSERVLYRGLVGDEQTVGSDTPEATRAGGYAQWVTQVNDNPGLSLFIDRLDPSLEPECVFPQARVTLTVRDDVEGRAVSWTRCASGFLGTLTPRGAGPDPSAARVVSAGLLARDFIFGDRFRSAFVGTLPFGTLDEGEDSGAPLTTPLVIQDPANWRVYWEDHRTDGTPLPEVDFETESVIVAAVGERLEAGDSVEVRRVLPVQSGTIVELVERVPGDFCSPAERRHTPFHIVVTPRLPEPVGFAQPVPVERVPCG